jgi:hypothetical protein
MWLHGNAGVFCAGLSALTRCDFKNPARWPGCYAAVARCLLPPAPERQRRLVFSQSSSVEWFPSGMAPILQYLKDD